MKATSSATALAVAALLCGDATAHAAPPRPPPRAPLPSAADARAGATYEEARLGGATRDVLVSHEVESLIRAKEKRLAERRATAIALIERYLAAHPRSPEEAEVLFQLAELRWEEAKSAFLVAMATYQSAVDKCAKQRCPVRPEPPVLRLDSSQVIYRKLIDEHPSFPKIDAVHYLYGFSLRDQGQLPAALAQFRRILDEHPKSRFRPDAWMAIAEARFYTDGDFKGALDGYNEVLKFPDSPLYDLALFKTAWCMWKLGDAEAAARRFKEVLDLGGKSYQAGKEGQKRLRELQSEALDYLVQIFTEDERKGPKEAYDFLASIGGTRYSRLVLDRLGDVFQTQARYSRAIETERFLIGLDPTHIDNPRHQERIVACYRAMDDGQGTVKELHRLVEDYAPDSAWATANEKPHPTEVDEARATASKLVREIGQELHAAAQAHEKAQKGHADLNRYARAADIYAYYLDHFSDEKEAVEIRYLLGDIEFFKRKRYEVAGDAYLGVGKSNPVGKRHKEALLNAISAFEKVRQAAVAKNPGLRTPLESDKKMGAAIDRYAELFPGDKEIGNLLYKNGELFYSYGDYDEAVKRFGLIVEKYPRDPAAAAAGDKILESLNKAKDYTNVEAWARRLLKTPAFSAKADQERLRRLVVDAGFKAGEQLAEKQPLEAATTFRRVADEFPSSPRAALALSNAGALLASNGKPEEAIKVYEQIVVKYSTAKEAPNAAWAMARLYEEAALWDPAARSYDLLANRYQSDPHAADALYNAGLLREHLGDTKTAIARYAEYARRYRDRDDAGDAAFRVGVVLEQSGDKEGAARAFLDYAGRYKGPRTVEALARAAASLIAAGADKRAAEPLERAVRLARTLPQKQVAHAAGRARYLLGELAFREYERIGFDVDPRRLRTALEKKSKKLEEARTLYVEAVAVGDPEWATASLYRIGDAYERFAKAMRSAPVPKELSEAEQQVYREEMEKVVIVIEEKAIDAYRNGWKKALELGIYNEFTQKLRQALGRLNDQEFPPENEARAGYVTADGDVTIAPIERVGK